MVKTYNDLVCLYLWSAWKEAADRIQLVEAMRIAFKDEAIPSEWIELVAESAVEESRWKTGEMRRG